MDLLDTYFSHLQRHTGAEAFIIVRDDAQVSPRSMKRRRAPRSASLPSSFGSSKSRQEFEESEGQNPPCPPLRMESQDDLFAMVKNITHNKIAVAKTPFALQSRFNSLFGAEIAANMDVKTGLVHRAQHAENKSMANLAAPKFPTRKDSSDDLSAWRSCSSSSSLLGDRLSSTSMVNKKLELSQFLDEVANVLDPSEESTTSSLGSYHSNCVSPQSHGWEKYYQKPESLPAIRLPPRQ